jgi:taurine transport system ATP-binding protein
VEEALLLGERLLVMAPRPGRVLLDERLPFAAASVGRDLRETKRTPAFATKRDEILGLIWGMEEEIMGRSEVAA